MSENEVEAEIISWLRAGGWICRRQHVGVFRTMDGRKLRLGELGECDWRCMKAVDGAKVKYFELECKATGKTPEPEQREYIAKRRHQGFIAIWADSLEMFLECFEIIK
jgi:hypothetical protein